MRDERRSERGVTLVEFALTFPLLILLVLGLIEFGRINSANSTVADAARQAARQAAPVANPNDWPFLSSGTSGNCSGTTSTPNANGTGCLTDARILETAKSVLSSLTGSVSLQSSTSSSACSLPSVGSATVCIDPAETSGAPPAFSPNTCAGATASLGHAPGAGDLGPREAEYVNQTFKGCFQVQVTVIYVYQPMTKEISAITGSSITLRATTSTVAEY